MAPPRKYSSPGAARAAKVASNRAYRRRQSESGMVTVTVLCPADRIEELKAIAAGFRAAASKRKEKVRKIIGAAPKTKPKVSDAEKQVIIRLYEEGAAPSAMMLPGMTIDDLVDLICENEDFSRVDVRRDLYNRHQKEPAWRR